MPTQNYKTEYGLPSATLEDEFKGSDWNEIQDCTEIIVPASEDEGVIPAYAYDSTASTSVFHGGNWLYGEWNVAAATDDVLDNTRNYLNCWADMYVYYVALAVDLPSGANHDPTNNLTSSHHALWDMKDGYALGGGMGAADACWNPFADIWIFARNDDSSGHLYIRNEHVGNTYRLYLMVKMTRQAVYA